MTEELVDASVTEWEDGIDLVLDTQVPLPPTQVWPYVTRSELLENWFVGYQADTGAADILLELDDQPVPAHVLSVTAPAEDTDTAHVLLEVDGIGRLGLTLAPLTHGEDGGGANTSDMQDAVTGGAEGAGPAVVGTRITLAHTIADRGIDRDVVAQAIAQVGPVWETHLRLLAGTLSDSPGAYDVPESQMTTRYEALAEEIG